MEFENPTERGVNPSEKIVRAPEINRPRFISDFPASVARAKERIEWDPDFPGLGRRFRSATSRGTWIVQWRRAGRSYRRTIGSAKSISRDAARVIARQLLHPAADAPPLALSGAPTLAEFIDTFQRDCAGRWKPRTRVAIGRLCRKYLVPAFGPRRIDAITRGEVVLWFESRKRSANWCLSILSSLMLHAEALGLRPDNSNPCAGLRRKKAGFTARYPTADDYRRIGAALATAPSRFFPSVQVIRFLAYTGARRGEALAMRWEHINNDRCVLPDSKTGPKTIWLPRPARELVELARADQTGPYVLGTDDRAQAVRALDRAWEYIRNAAGLNRLRLHDLRHGFASVAVGQGHDLRIVAGLLGHSDFATTLGYAHLAQSHLTAAADRVSRRLASAIGMSETVESPETKPPPSPPHRNVESSHRGVQP